MNKKKTADSVLPWALCGVMFVSYIATVVAFAVTDADKNKEISRLESYNADIMQQLTDSLKTIEELEAAAEEQKNVQPQYFELSNGNYLVGEDIEAGTYDIMAVSGSGNIYSDNINEWINEMLSADPDDEFYSQRFNNYTCTDGTTITISNGLTVKFKKIK